LAWRLARSIATGIWRTEA